MLGEPVEERIGSRVVRLAYRAEDTGCRRKHHERGEVRRCGEFVQVPRCVDLRTKHRVKVMWRLRGEYGVIEHTRGVDDCGQRVLDRYRGQESP